MSTDYNTAAQTAAQIAADVLLDALAPHLSDVLGEGPAMFDGRVRDLMRLVGLLVVQGFGVRLAELIVERTKSHGFKIERSPTIEFLTLFGFISVKSPYMVSDNGETDRPVNRILKVRGKGKTPLVKRALTDFGVDASGQRANRKFQEHYGIDVNRTSILRVVKEQGRRAMDFIAELLMCAELIAGLEEPDDAVETASVDTLPAAVTGVDRPGTTAHDHGDELDDESKEPIDTMLVELDGSEVRTGKLVPIEGSTELTPVRKLPKRRRETEWRDVRVGLVRPLRPLSETKSYVASLGSYDALAADLHALAALRGATASTTYVKVLDGGNGLREALDRKMSGPTILDKPHARSHLFDTAKAMAASDASATRDAVDSSTVQRSPASTKGPKATAKPADTPPTAPAPVTSSRRAIVDRWNKTMAAGNVDSVINELEAWRPSRWTEAEEIELRKPRNTVKLPHSGLDRVRQLVAHLRRFSDAVHYDDFKAANYPIGDGEIESAHRVIPQARLKIPGTWWLPETIDEILALRVVRENGWWDEFWASSQPVALAA